MLNANDASARTSYFYLVSFVHSRRGSAGYTVHLNTVELFFPKHLVKYTVSTGTC